MSVTRLRRSRIAPPHLYIADTEDYLIKQIDINSGALANSFKRDYPRLRNPKSEIKEMRMKFPEFENDVQALLVHKNRLWVLTSTFDPKRGILVDVFDEQGKYMDNFFLPLSNVRTGGEFSLRYMPMTIEGNFLYAVEHDKDWNYSVVKYRIGE
jgi:hypothetical protein